MSFAADDFSPDTMIPFAEATRFLANCERVTGLEHFRPMLGARYDHLSFGPIGQAMRAAPTLADAVACAKRKPKAEFRSTRSPSSQFRLGECRQELAMSFSRQVYLEVDGEKDLSLLMSYHNGETGQDWFEIEVFKSKDAIGKARWSVDGAHNALIFDPSSALDHPATACVTKCLGISVSKGLAECLWGSGGDLQKIRKCIKEKAVSVLLDAAGCVAGCL